MVWLPLFWYLKLAIMKWDMIKLDSSKYALLMPWPGCNRRGWEYFPSPSFISIFYSGYDKRIVEKNKLKVCNFSKVLFWGTLWREQLWWLYWERRVHYPFLKWNKTGVSSRFIQKSLLSRLPRYLILFSA